MVERGEEERQERVASDGINETFDYRSYHRLSIAGLLNRCSILNTELQCFEQRLQAFKQISVANDVRPLRNAVNAEARMLTRLQAEYSDVETSQKQEVDSREQQETVNESVNDINANGIDQYDEDDVVSSDSDIEDVAKPRSVQPRKFSVDSVDRADHVTTVLRSSNVPFYEAVWSVAKHVGGVLGFEKRFYRDNESSASAPAKLRKSARQSAFVDVVAQGGTRWIKVSMVTETRLLFELAELGLDFENDDELSGEEVKEISIVSMADSLANAAQTHRVAYQRPRVALYLPRLQNVGKDVGIIQHLIDRVKAAGAEVVTDICDFGPCPTLKESQCGEGGRASPLYEGVLKRLLCNPLDALTETVNLDCTILLALVSDISHFANPVPPGLEQTLHSHTRQQIDLEKNEKLLPGTLYPLMEGRRLVCSAGAYRRMQEIVENVGTPTERARALCLVSHLSNNSHGDDDLRNAHKTLQDLSEHEVPSELLLPIMVCPCEISLGVPPSAGHHQGPGMINVDYAKAIEEMLISKLSEINASVFLFGWRTGFTTMTSNRSAARLIYSEVTRILDAFTNDSSAFNPVKKVSKSLGPNIWICSVARSLVGKEKSRKEG